MQQQKQAFAEVIESSIVQATGLCWDWAQLPTLCALIKIHQPPYTLFGCITNIKTGTNDPLRQPFAYQKTEAELRQEQPQIFAFLQTSFNIQILGYQKHGSSISYLLPPQPAKLHGFISYATEEEYRLFFNNPEFLNLFFLQNDTGIDQDELLLALLRNLKEVLGIDPVFIQNLCAYHSSMNRIDYKDLKRFMQRIQQFFDTK
ncbi:hypothetical protein FJ364_04465 [Candidatus Dependentiae bacterium]|nr:hypothetical protein [Candidatus Dependentiae bacterium]